jgi:hypothetical protein
MIFFIAALYDSKIIIARILSQHTPTKKALIRGLPYNLDRDSLIDPDML